jgi:hypothetical protein
VGLYQDRVFGTQSRAGVDTSINLSPAVQLQPSLQLASQGFVGGSVAVQVGGASYGFAGIGRTNLEPYFNLNFDPNDAITLGAGHRTDQGALYTLFVVADDRLYTRQRDWHLQARLPDGNRRLTVDLLRKSGLSDVGPIRAWGGTSPTTGHRGSCGWHAIHTRVSRRKMRGALRPVCGNRAPH